MHKSTADVEGGRALYDRYSAVTTDGGHNFLRLRETVLLRKEARKMFVQANTRIIGQIPCSDSLILQTIVLSNPEHLPLSKEALLIPF